MPRMAHITVYSIAVIAVQVQKTTCHLCHHCVTIEMGIPIIEQGDGILLYYACALTMYFYKVAMNVG